jgi:hypothetical protein
MYTPDVPPIAAPTFRFEENRLVYSLRLIAYPGDSFTSEQSVRCAFAVTAVRRGDRSAPEHERDPEEWGRVVELLVSVEPSAWVAAATEARIEETTRIARRDPRATEL